MTWGRNKQSTAPPVTAQALARDAVLRPPAELPILPPGRMIGFPGSGVAKTADQSGGVQSAGPFYPGGGIRTLVRPSFRIPDFAAYFDIGKTRRRPEAPLEQAETRQPDVGPDHAPRTPSTETRPSGEDHPDNAQDADKQKSR